MIAVACGLLLGTLNAEPVTLDLLWVQLDWPLGLVTVMALALGVLLGIAATWIIQVWPLRMALRRAKTAGHTATPESTKETRNQGAELRAPDDLST